MVHSDLGPQGSCPGIVCRVKGHDRKRRFYSEVISAINSSQGDGEWCIGRDWGKLESCAPFCRHSKIFQNRCAWQTKPSCGPEAAPVSLHVTRGLEHQWLYLELGATQDHARAGWSQPKPHVRQDRQGDREGE